MLSIVSFLKLKVAYLINPLHKFYLGSLSFYSRKINSKLFFLHNFRMWGACIFLLSSCTKVIEVNLNNAEKKYVIEGVITNQPGYCQISITQTVNFDEANNFPGISGAIVTIQDDNNLPVTLTETNAGLYNTNALNGNVGHTYTLSVNIGGKAFIAVSKMPVQVNFDSLCITTSGLFGNSTKYADVIFNDPPGKGNYYHFIQYKNGKQNKSVIVNNDDFTDGRLNNTFLMVQNDDSDDDIETGDIVKVEMQCIDASVYKYWYSLNAGSTGSSQTATPSNPVSNISGGVLGYFNAHTVQSKTVISP
jgi:Domain of unknown function (DUF4249)